MSNPNKQTAIQAAQLRQLFAASNASLVSSTLLAAILAYMQRDMIDSSIVLTWLTLIVLVAVSRTLLVKAYRSAAPEQEAGTRFWLKRFRIGVLAVGLVWGAAGFLMFPANGPQHQIFLIFMLAGLSAGGVVAFSADLQSAVLFSVTSLLPIIIRLFATGDSLFMAMGMAGLLYLGFMIVSLRRINRSITENIVLHLDAAEREEAMRISEQRYRLLLKHSPIGIFHYDTDLIVTYCNEPFADILRNTVEGIVGLDIKSFKDRSILAALRQALKGEKEVYEGEYKPSPDTAGIWIDMTCAPSRDGTGKIVGGIAIIRDISERKQAEDMLRVSAIAFESQAAMIVTSPDAVILRVNRAFTALTGYKAEEVLGQTPHMLNSGRHDRGFFAGMWTLLRETGHWQGEIWNRRKNGLIVAEWLTIAAVVAPDGRITHYVGTFSDITENKDAVAEIHRLAYYDPLTHLPNRRLLQDRLGQELVAGARNGLYGAILFLDLDNFKTLNDTRGHDAGDQLLVEVARRLRSTVRECDIVGRLGGDEFLVLLADLSADAEVAAMQTKQVGEKLLEALAYPYDLSGYEFHCSASIGIRLYRDQEIAEELLRHADLAMYQAKMAGRNTVRFFDPSMQAMATARADLEKDLRRALAHNQFKLYFQPQMYRNDQVVGAEVLLRWQHPERGLVSPLEFISLAEKTSLILPIGRCVLDAACTQLKLWERSAYSRQFRLAVNVSARQFRTVDFVEQVQQALNSKGINPELLELELTESLVLENINDTILKMHALRDMGVRFSLDDFGTGYSSFSYLTQLPFDQLKIDRSFVRNIGVKTSDAVIVQTIIGMAHNLGIEVIAEGVETEAQRLFLEQHGCHACQGFLFSKPVPIEEFIVWHRRLRHQ
ncbi:MULTISPECIES: bifunctional diguanylate cyclase/phosphodiesterase [Methylomonas]|uniref:cyclic-guanylate-specific phosphodiesterase n=2 Tax=Methylomonas TaxID=416 RepID=A0A140E488_9GAMM|nr:MULTISPECIES: bifunctional diguanylate cyclase/phosphodiesterase [Methylomonas]AMK75212.1 diguanylate cyclase [Methylomonas denitrificans]OAH99392.1 diguanylate cyclase [Methylomonas methanica]TCV85040.1 PAS domain S-box-containing protein/diguanylate cyclase (GGDEF)-like protein [Methylomonas methanica]